VKNNKLPLPHLVYNQLKNLPEASRPLLRAAISLSLLSLLLWKVNLGKLKGLLLSSQWRLVLLAVLIYIGGQMLCSYKWQLLLKSLGSQKRLLSLVKLYFIGMFFNLFMPTIIGGDAIRIYLASDDLEKFPQSASSVFMERSTGLFALFSIAIVSSLVFPLQLGRYSISLLVLLAFLFFFFIFFILIFRPWIYNLGSKLLEQIGLRRIGNKFKEVWSTLNRYKEKKVVLGIAFVYSLIFQLLVIAVNMVNARAMGISLSPKYFFIFIPVIAVLGMFPFTINGIGLRETGYTILFATVGLSSEAGLSLGLLWLAVLLLSSLPGGLFYLFLRRRRIEIKKTNHNPETDLPKEDNHAQ